MTSPRFFGATSASFSPLSSSLLPRKLLVEVANPMATLQDARPVVLALLKHMGEERAAGRVVSGVGRTQPIMCRSLLRRSVR